MLIVEFHQDRGEGVRALVTMSPERRFFSRSGFPKPYRPCTHMRTHMRVTYMLTTHMLTHMHMRTHMHTHMQEG